MDEKLVFDFIVDKVPVKARYIFLKLVSQHKKISQTEAMNVFCDINFLYVILRKSKQLSQCGV